MRRDSSDARLLGLESLLVLECVAIHRIPNTTDFTNVPRMRTSKIPRGAADAPVFLSAFSVPDTVPTQGGLQAGLLLLLVAVVVGRGRARERLVVVQVKP